MANPAVKSKKPAPPRATARRAQPKAIRRASKPTAAEVEARKAVARTFFDPTAAAAARAAFLKRQQPNADHAG